MYRTKPDPNVESQQQLIDQLQIALPLAQRLKVTLRQQLDDVSTLHIALEKITALYAAQLRQQREQHDARERFDDMQQRNDGRKS